jgi:hypothetical protein
MTGHFCYLRHELVCDRFLAFEGDPVQYQGSLEEQPEGQLRHLGLDQRRDGRVTKLENLCHFLLPLFVLNLKKEDHYFLGNGTGPINVILLCNMFV